MKNTSEYQHMDRRKYTPEIIIKSQYGLIANIKRWNLLFFALSSLPTNGCTTKQTPFSTMLTTSITENCAQKMNSAGFIFVRVTSSRQYKHEFWTFNSKVCFFCFALSSITMCDILLHMQCIYSRCCCKHAHFVHLRYPLKYAIN